MMSLEARSVARFYRDFLAGLRSRGIDVAISPKPVEVADAIPFHLDEGHDSYDPQRAQLLWRALVQADRLLKVFQSGSSARPARSTCSGAASISRRRASRATRHRATRAASPTARAGSWRRPNLTRT